MIKKCMLLVYINKMTEIHTSMRMLKLETCVLFRKFSRRVWLLCNTLQNYVFFSQINEASDKNQIISKIGCINNYSRQQLHHRSYCIPAIDNAFLCAYILVERVSAIVHNKNNCVISRTKCNYKLESANE